MGNKKKKVRPQYVAKANRKREPMPKKTKIGLFVGVGLLLLCFILFIVLYDDGSLPVRNGVIADTQDNWIISKLLTASSEKYFKLGEVTGFLDEFELNTEDSIKADTNETAFSYEPIDPDSQIDGYYISGVATTADDMVTGLPLQFALYFPGSQFSDPGTIEIAGTQARYLTAILPETILEEEETADDTQEEATPESATETDETASDSAAETDEAASDSAAETDETASDNASETSEDAPESSETDEPLTAEALYASDGRTATQQILCYIPTIRNSCIFVSVTLRIDEEMQEWPEEALLDLVQRIGETIVLEK